MEEMWLSNFQIIHSKYPDQIREMVAEVMVPHRLIPRGQDAKLDTIVRGRTLPNLGLYYINYGGDVSIELDQPTDTYFAVQSPTSGDVEIDSNGHTFISTVDCASVISPKDDLKMQWPRGCGQLICQVGKAALESHLAGLLGTSLRKPLWFRRALDVSKGPGLGVRIMMEQLGRHINRRDALLDDLANARHTEQDFMTELLYSQWHNYTDTLSVEASAATSKEVQTVIDLLQSHPERAHTIYGLARRVDISARSLQRRLRRERGTTFQELLQDIRLQRIHDELRAADPDVVNVIDVMIRWRTPPTGHSFNRYRELFGESPGETLKRLC